MIPESGGSTGRLEVLLLYHPSFLVQLQYGPYKRNSKVFLESYALETAYLLRFTALRSTVDSTVGEFIDCTKFIKKI